MLTTQENDRLTRVGPGTRHHVNIAFDEFEHGIVKRRLLEGQREDCDDWTIGHPVVFPTTLALGKLAAMERGEDPKCVNRDPAKDVVIDLPLEKIKHLRTDGFEMLMRRHFVRFSPIIEDLVELYADAGKGETALV